MDYRRDLGRIEGNPWSLGFFILAHIIARGDRPALYGFTHNVGGGHPAPCERQAVDAWSLTGELEDRRPSLLRLQLAPPE